MARMREIQTLYSPFTCFDKCNCPISTSVSGTCACYIHEKPIPGDILSAWHGHVHGSVHVCVQHVCVSLSAIAYIWIVLRQ